MNPVIFAYKALRALISPRYRFLALAHRGFYDSMPDEEYLKRMYKCEMGRELDLQNPKTLTEKMQWLKLYDRNPEYTALSDKYEAKSRIAALIGEEYVIPTLGVWDDVGDIDFDMLPEKFALKCTHDSGSVLLCMDRKRFSIPAARRKLTRSLRRNFYFQAREWCYKDIKPRIIAEPYLTDESGSELKDYKIFCFNGNPEYVEVDFNRFIKHKLNPYDFDWNPLNFCDTSKNDYSADIPRPERLDDMREIARTLSRGKKLLRVDFYSIGSRIYVGELTFYPGGGFIHFDPPEVDYRYGALLRLED